MVKYLTFLALSMVSVVSVAATPPSHIRTQTPCMVAGHTREQACVVVDKTVSGNNPTVTVTMDLSPALALRGKARVFSVIYAYQLRRGGLNNSVGLIVNRGDHGVDVDVGTTDPVFVWVTTRDGGASWSPIGTSESGAMSF